MTDRITTRPCIPADAPLLFAIFAEEKTAELAPIGLTTEQLQRLLQMQYRARELTYAQAWPNALDTLLSNEDGTPLGRILLDRQPDGYRVIDVAILRRHRNRGIGGWAIRQVQQPSIKESLPVRLRVVTPSSAQRLYERLGFAAVSCDEISCEMEWEPSVPATSSRYPQHLAETTRDPARRADHEEVVHAIVAFLREIGLEVHFGSLLPGIQAAPNGLYIDPDTLLYPGDLLHEAGHLAVMPPSQRLAESPASADAAEEMGAIAWSYAAALQIGIDPQIVFHEHGYWGQASELLHDFTHGKCVGPPYLWWIGLTSQPLPGKPSLYPRMLRWLREEPSPTPEAEADSLALQAHA